VPLRIFLLALWFGLATGLVELGTLLVRNRFSGGVSLGILQLNRHFLWMTPAADLVLFLATGIALGLASCLRPGPVGRWAPALLSFLTFLALLLTIPGLYPVAAVTLAAGAARLADRLLRPHGPRLRRLATASLPLLALLAVGLALRDLGGSPKAAHGSSAAPLPADGTSTRPNVLLLVLDTVRAESLSLHGYHRDTSPNLKRIAARGVRFDQARSTAPWTFPSHASLFTGRWPHELKVGEDRPLDATYPTLAEVLGRRGYDTAGFVANTYFCNAWYGLGRGFDVYEDFYDEEMSVSLTETLDCSALGRRLLKLSGFPSGKDRRRKDAARIGRDLLEWLDGRPGRPFFAFLNFFDAHTPYVVPGGVEHPFGLRPRTPEEEATLREWDERPKQNLPEHDVALAHDAYDDCIAYLDRQLGLLFDELEARGVLENTLVIVTSDHGEELGEHGLHGHGKSLYSQETRVPLVIVPPGGLEAGLAVAEPVSLRDVPATIAEAALPAGESPFPGRSLGRFWRGSPGDAATAADPVFSEVSLRQVVSRNPHRPPAWRGPMQSLVLDGKAYIRNADGRPELYDYRDDPTDSRDLAGSPELAPVLDRLRGVLESWKAGVGTPP
jgi:arylsulfatase A-like enzyme